jgi:hypothetical protein
MLGWCNVLQDHKERGCCVCWFFVFFLEDQRTESYSRVRVRGEGRSLCHSAEEEDGLLHGLFLAEKCYHEAGQAVRWLMTKALPWGVSCQGSTGPGLKTAEFIS